MRWIGRPVWGIILGLALLLEACQPTAPVKIPQASAPLRAASATPRAEPTSTPLPAGYPTLPEPTDYIFHASDPLTWVEAVSSEPKTLDPALEYETVGSNILSHIYDPLITYKKDQKDSLVPALAQQVPSRENGGISLDGRTYTFKIRPDVQFHDGSLLTASDVAYSFQRGLLQGGTSSPQWLFTEAFFGPGVDDVAVLLDDLQPPYNDRSTLSAFPPDRLLEVCLTVKDAIRANDLERTVTFQLKQPWSPFLAALPGSWGSITSQAWMKDHGGWDGDCATWQNSYGANPDDSQIATIGRAAMGTGPFRLDHWTEGEELVLAANQSYWRTEPAWEGGPSGAPQLHKVVLKFIPEFSSRLALLQNGEVDAVEVPRGEEKLLDAMVGEVCDAPSGDCQVTGNKDQFLRRWEQIPATDRLDVLFTFSLNTDSNPYIGSGHLDGEGIPSGFFNDAHIRRAFSYCFNGETYQQSVLEGRGQRSPNLIPAGFLNGQLDGERYEFDPEKCAAEFKASTLTSADGHALWETGFRMAIAYPIGNTAFQTIAQIWQQELGQINPKFVVAVTGLPWQAYVNGLLAHQLPVFYGRWMGDIADPHNWVSPYVNGCFALRQLLPANYKQSYLELAARAAQESDPQQRTLIYAELNRQFLENATTLFLYQSADRMYLPRYVRGFYANPFLPGTVNWYAISKE